MLFRVIDLVYKFPYFFLIIFSCILFLPGIADLPVIDRDEAHFAQATRQMLETGNFFQIRFQEKTRFQKPPGINWLQVAAIKLLGEQRISSIWPYRLPSFLGALFSVLFTFYFARRFLDVETALTGATLLGSCLLLAIEAHMAVIDASLLFSIVLMQGALWVIYTDTNNNRTNFFNVALFWAALSYGFLLKGVTPLVGFLSLSTLSIVDRNVRWVLKLHPLKGMAFFVCCSLLWLYFINEAEQSNYLMQMFHKDLLPKLQGGHESHGKPPLFHLFLLPITFWPASLFLWQGIAKGWRSRHQRHVKFLLAWIVPTWVFFEFMPTKLPQYVLPTFPALALLCAMGLESHQKTKLFLKTLQVLWAILSIGLALAFCSISFLLFNYLTPRSIIIFAMISISSLISFLFAYRGKFQRAVLSVCLTAAISFPMIFSQLLPSLVPLWTSMQIASKLKNYVISNEKPLVIVGYGEPSLVFYLNTHSVLFSELSKDLDLKYRDNLFLIDKALLSQISMPICVLDEINGYNYSKGKWVKLLLLRLGRFSNCMNP